MLRRLLGSFIVAAVTMGGVSASAQSPLDAIPGDVSVVIKLKAPDTTLAKLGAFVNGVQPGMGQLVQMQGGALGVAISNPTQVGVDRTKDWYIAVSMSATELPGTVFAIPAKDADAMQKSIGGGFKFATHAGYVLYTDDAATAEKVTERIGGGGTALAIDERAKGVMDGAEFSLYVNVDQVTEVYKDQLEMAALAASNAIENASAFMPPTPGVDMGPVLEIAGDFVTALFQGIRDAESVTVALGVSESALTLEEFCTFQADSPTDQFLKRHATSELALLNKLPHGALAYFGAHVDMSGMMAMGMEFSKAMFEGKEDVLAALDESIAVYNEAKIGDSVGSFSLGSLETGAVEATVVSEITPTDKVRDVTRKASLAMNGLETQGIKQEITVAADAEKFGEYSADVVTIKQELPADNPAAAIQEQVMTALFGSDGMVQRNGYLPDKIMQVYGGNGKDRTGAAIVAVTRDSADAEEAAQATRSQLTQKSNLVVLVDLPTTAVKVLGLVAKSGLPGVPVTPEIVDSIEVGRSFLGYSIACEANAVRSKTVIPVSQIQGIVQIVMTMQQLAAQPQF